MSAPFVTSLGVRPETVRVVDEMSLKDARTSWLTLRVHSAEAWDAVRVETTSGTTVRRVKQAALAVLMPEVDALDNYVVKLHGHEIRNEALSLSEADVRNGATLLVMSRRRRAVR